MTERIKAWSYSRLSTYEACPYKAKLLYIDGFREPSNKFMERGTTIHAELEEYLKGPGGRVPQSALKMEEECQALWARRPYTELSVGLNDKYQSVDWMAVDIWARIKIDVLVKEGNDIEIIDFKTGQIRDGYGEQLELYALTGLAMFPKAQEVKTANYYVDAGKILPGIVYTRADFEDLKVKWTAKVTPMLTDEEFLPKKNQYCYNCQFRKSNGGSCVIDA